MAKPRRSAGVDQIIGSNWQEDSDPAFNMFSETTLEQQFQDHSIQEIEITQLLDNPYQYLARQELSEETLEELADSIRQNGFFGALLARRRDDAGYELAYGHRRRSAARKAGLTKLPVKVVSLNNSQMLGIMAAENFSREDLDELSQAQVVGAIVEQGNLSLKQAAQTLGRTEDWLRPRLALYESGPDIKKLVRSRALSLSHAVALKRVRDSQQRAALIQAVQNEHLTAEALESRIRSIENVRTRSSDATKPVPSSDLRSPQSNTLHPSVEEETKQMFVNNVTTLGSPLSSDKVHNHNYNTEVDTVLRINGRDYPEKAAIDTGSSSIDRDRDWPENELKGQAQATLLRDLAALTNQIEGMEDWSKDKRQDIAELAKRLNVIAEKMD